MKQDKLFQNASWQLDDDEDNYADDDLNSPLFSPEMEAGFARARNILMEHLRERQAASAEGGWLKQMNTALYQPQQQ
ncbi:MAG: hypothetical protein V2A77_01030, partial [Pseudomonadota bacterium]